MSKTLETFHAIRHRPYLTIYVRSVRYTFPVAAVIVRWECQGGLI